MKSMSSSLSSKSPKRMLFQWIVENADAAGIARMVSCIKEYQSEFSLTGGVKADSSIKNSSLALDQLFRYESQRKSLFDILLNSFFEPYRREFEDIVKEAEEAFKKFDDEVSKEKLDAYSEYKKRIGRRGFAWMAYVWAEGKINWQVESNFIHWFLFTTRKVPNLTRGNVILEPAEILVVLAGAVKPSGIDGRQDWNEFLTKGVVTPLPETAKETPKPAPAKKTAKGKSVRGVASAIRGSKEKAAEQKAEPKTEPAPAPAPEPKPAPEPAPVAPEPEAKPAAEEKPAEPKKEAVPYQPKPVSRVFEVKNRMTPISMPGPGVTRYLGYVRRYQNLLNFNVVGEYLAGGWLQDSGPEVYTHTFPSRGGIALKTTRRATIPDGALMTLDLMPSDLDVNIDWSTKAKRNDFEKCVDLDALQRAGRFRPAAESLCYVVVYPDTDRLPVPDFEKNIPVRMSTYDADANGLEPRMINLPVVLAYEGYFYGPTSLREDSSHSLYVNLQTAATMGLVHAWSMQGSRTVHMNVFSAMEDTGPVRKAVDVVSFRTLQEVLRDVASDSTLLRKLTQVVSADRAERDRMIDWMEKSSEAPYIFSDDDRVSAARCARIQNMLAADARNDRFISTAAKLLSNALDTDGENADDPMVTRVVEQVAADPKILKKLESHRIIKARMDELRGDCERMQTELNDLAKRHREEEERFKAEVEDKNKQLITENSKLEKTLEEKQKKLGALEACADDIEMRNRLAAEMKELEARRDELTSQVEGIGDLLKKSVRDCRSVAFDGALASKFRAAAAEWESGVETEAFAGRFAAVKTLVPSKLEGRQLTDYLVNAIGAERAYTRNDILNLFICATQSFLTIFAGAPGCGKTSICHMMGRVLGLADPAPYLPADSTANPDELARFLPVAVGRGWTSRRDLLGYWNPLSKTFESSDPRRWEALRELDAEQRAGWKGLPFMMLLDEANLSAMEHYWGDFMTIADERRTAAAVSLGEGMLYRIPETLRFLATINNDHTVESLSPRLIDRATIVTLPELPCAGLLSDEPAVKTADPKLVAWPALQALFGARPIKTRRTEIEDLLVGLYEAFAKAGMPLSPRSRRAAEGYVSAAAAVFESSDRPAYIQAVDYAVVQKLLPRISGSGEDFRKQLTAIRDSLENSALEKSCAMLDDIIRRGDDNMAYFRFF